jgi:hypothetical protein
MSDEGKRWFKVTGLADTPAAYTFQRSEYDARCETGQAYLEVEPMTEAEVRAYFENLSKPKTEAPKG